MHIVNYHYFGTKNIGDSVCAPLNYFNFDGHVQLMSDVHAWVPKKADKILHIFGGGGLLHYGTMDYLARAVNSAEPCVLWGAGTNLHGNKEIFHPKFLDEFKLVGIRDAVPHYQHVPCVSCMCHDFDTDADADPEYDVVSYSHYDHKIPIVAGITNAFGTPITDVINHLRSGRVVITNSYHGAYWAMLLDRKVLLYEPFSNRFESLLTLNIKNVPVVCNRSNWAEKLVKLLNSEALAPSDKSWFLKYCRQTNTDFYEQVKALVERMKT